MLPPGTLVRQTVASPVDVTVRIFFGGFGWRSKPMNDTLYPNGLVWYVYLDLPLKSTKCRVSSGLWFHIFLSLQPGIEEDSHCDYYFSKGVETTN